MEKENAHILIVDDDPGILHSANMFLKQVFKKVSVSAEATKMTKFLQAGNIDVVLLDMNLSRGEMDGSEGLALLDQILEMDPDLPVILITAYGDFDLAVRGIKSGAFDFLVKPWKNQRLHASVLSALQLRQSRNLATSCRETARVLESDNRQDYTEFIGDSLAMKRVKDLIARVGPTDADVLITGENGTGKELAAHRLHANSNRSSQRFMKVDIGSLNEQLFESELFGHEKGSFTDAREKRIGRFELASGGTLFLDEIGNLDMKLQAKILSVLQNREIFRVGGSSPIPVDIRLICATNMDLEQRVREGSFREDLYYRINMFEIAIPPLRDRPDDIPPLVDHYLEQFCRKYHRAPLRVGSTLMDRLRNHAWPGNIRELRNSLERAVILESSGQLSQETLFPSSRKDASTPRGRKSFNLVENEKQLILEAISKNQGNMTRTAQDLGLERTALYRRMKKYGL
jgi:DNA-binding NtrC family response regulator